MITKGRLSGVLMLLPLLQAASVAVAEDAPFTYSDDWGLVSAPPPPGTSAVAHVAAESMEAKHDLTPRRRPDHHPKLTPIGEPND